MGQPGCLSQAAPRLCVPIRVAVILVCGSSLGKNAARGKEGAVFLSRKIKIFR